MSKHKFQIGDRVKVNCESERTHGHIGAVIAYDGDLPLFESDDQKFKGHNGSGFTPQLGRLGESGRCWWQRDDQLERLPA